MAKIYTIISGKGGTGKSLGYLEYVSLANGDVIQIGPYVDSLFEKNKRKIKQLIIQTNLGQEIFEVVEPPEDLVLNIVRQENEQILSERKKPMCIIRKPAPKKLLKIKTANGNIKVTKEHKFLVMRDGNLKKIKANELITKKDYLLTFNYPFMIANFESGPLEIARLLGYLIGDGYIEKRKNRFLIHIFCEDSEEKNLKNIKKTFQKVFGEFKILKDKRTGVIRISFMKSELIKEIFLNYGIKPTISYLKEVPKKLFCLDNNFCSEFLSALFDCDGHVCKRQNEIQYSTKSEKLAYQIMNLLRIRFGIESQLKEKYKKVTNSKRNKQKYFEIIISGEDIYKFYININFENKFKQDRLKEKIKFINYNTNIKLLPIGKLIKIIRNDNKITAKKLADLLGCTKQMIYEYEWGLYALSKNSVGRILNAFRKLGVAHEKLEFIEKLLERGFSFRRVENIEEVEYNFPYVYDFQVCEEGGHFVHGTSIVISNTTTAVNLGAAFNRFKEDVVILDANLTTPNLGLHFGSPVVPVSLNHILRGEAEIEDAIYEHESGTKIVPSSLSLKDMKNIKLKELRNISKELKKISNNIILDSAAGLGNEAIEAIKSGDEIIVVVNPNILSVTDALKTAKLAEQHDKRVRGAIVTRVKGNKNEMSLKSIREMLEVPILGVVPEDKAVEESLNKKDAVIHTKPKSKAAKAYRDIAAKLLGKKKMPKSLLNRILGSLGFG